MILFFKKIGNSFGTLSFQVKTLVLVFIVASGMLSIIVLSQYSTYVIKQNFDNLFDKRTKYLIKLEEIKDNYKVNIQETLKDFENKDISLNQAQEVIQLAQQLIKTSWHSYMDESRNTADEYFITQFVRNNFIDEQNSIKGKLLHKQLLFNVNRKISKINIILMLINEQNIEKLHKELDIQINNVSIYLTSLINYELSLAIEEKRNTAKIFDMIMTYSIISIILVFLFSILFSVIIINHFKNLHNSLEEKVEEKTKELLELNQYLEIKISKEVAQNRKKDLIMFQQARLASLGEMLGNIAHQWRQPLGSLMMIIQSFKTKMDRGKLSYEFVEEKVNDAGLLAQNMSNTLDDFRNFFEPNKTKNSFEISSCIEHSLELSKYSLMQSNIKVELDLKKDIEISGYYNELSHVFLNIISNSKDALLSHSDKDARIIDITLKKQKNNAIVTIIDNGGGIDESILPKVFEPYYTTKYKSAGTGIGLYMSKQIVEKHMDGTIECNTIKKRFFDKEFTCTVFVIQLPIKE